MKSSAAATILSLLATIVQAAPAPVPQTTYNLNPYSRSCGAYLLAAAGVSAFASAPIDFQVHSIDAPFSASQIYNEDNGMFEYVTFYGIDGSVTTVAPGETVAIGPPQV
ncbi:MAG: hypothetical protein MMC33_008759 [Icmadophila ericetorum]|nr:hypothetical protein [Icmadophila ericetorum]